MRGQWLAWAPQYVRDGAMASVTHVIMWTPPYLLDNGAEAVHGFWDLQTRANWDAGTPQPDYVPLDYPGYDVDRIAEWAGQQAGYPVDLIPDMTQIRLHRFGRARSEPIFYVVPAGIA